MRLADETRRVQGENIDRMIRELFGVPAGQLSTAD
jgi:hypothetical protein